MNVLWDFRLFSYGYRERGVGIYTIAVAQELLNTCNGMNVYIWGEKSMVPIVFHRHDIKWIEYKKEKDSWKKSVLQIPLIIIRNGIRLIHYWIALGPLSSIGISPFVTCRSIATIYDAGVEMWELPHSKFIKKTPYWQMQKIFIKCISMVITISDTARNDILMIDHLPEKKHVVVYPPLYNKIGSWNHGTVKRENYFMTLGGSIHKNCHRVVEAFQIFRKHRSDYKLQIWGTVHKSEEGLNNFPNNILYKPDMTHYYEALQKCRALIFCSLYEGLGIPPIEGMAFGTPLLLSSIPSLLEICSGYALFANPYSVDAIAEGMNTIADNTEIWSKRSSAGGKNYKNRYSRSMVNLSNYYLT